jgi:hypothetical protein
MLEQGVVHNRGEVAVAFTPVSARARLPAPARAPAKPNTTNPHPLLGRVTFGIPTNNPNLCLHNAMVVQICPAHS